jgi:periplasmic protein TonB
MKASLERRSLLCLVLPAPRMPARARSVRAGGIMSVAFHVIVVTSLMLLAARAGSITASSPDPTRHRTPLQLPRIVFLPTPGPAGGGGGSGNRQPDPPSRAQDIGRDRLTAPVVEPFIATARPTDLTPPPRQPVLEARPVALGTTFLTGLPDAPSSLPFSQGPGVGGGAGDGTGSGIGSGAGPGAGPGSGGGAGGGVYRAGGRVVPPIPLKRVTPKYTPDGVTHNIEGTVGLEVVVGRDGIPLTVRVTRSLDPGGLDEEAVAAAREWRFVPGRIGETPVDVVIAILMDFRIS